MVGKNQRCRYIERFPYLEGRSKDVGSFAATRTDRTSRAVSVVTVESGSGVIGGATQLDATAKERVAISFDE